MTLAEFDAWLKYMELSDRRAQQKQKPQLSEQPGPSHVI
jgi:hypothetical protein